MCTTACARGWTVADRLHEGAPPRGARQAALSRYSRRVRWMKVVLPVGALLLIGAIFLAGRSGEPPAGLLSAEEIATLSAGLRLESPRFAGRMETGEPFILRAAAAEPEGAAPDVIHLEAPDGEITLSDGRLLTARSETGVMRREAERLRLDGAVTIETSDGYRFESERLLLDLAERRARSPVPVRGTGPPGSIEAGRMRVLDGGKGASEARILFEGGVRVVFIPRESRPAAAGE